MLIGLIKEEYGWKRILEQEKVPWEIFNVNKINKYSLIILNSRDLSIENLIKIKNYLENGGALLTDTLSFRKLSIKEISKIYIKSIYGKGNLFRNINKLNIERFCYKFKNSPIIYNSRIGKGFVIALPFDLNELILDERSKKLYLPSIYSSLKENISFVSKGDLRRLVVNCFIYLHLARNLPYFHIWYYPKNYESVFCYRIDLDVYNKNEMDSIIKIIKKHKIKFNWFVSVFNVRNHENEIKNLYKLNQDIQSHSYEHIVYNSFEENYQNIIKSNEFISQNIKRPIGFAAPFGYWNKNLGKALEELNYFYSSEFSLSYDDLPFYPENCKVIQLPIYPTCIGLLRMQLYSERKMKNYLNYLINMQYKKQMPLFLYDHPNNGIGRYPELLNFTLNKIKSLDNILISDLTSFAKWWKEREKINIKISKNEIITNNRSNNLYLRIIFPDYKESRIILKNQIINFDELKLNQMPFFKDIKINGFSILKSKLLFSIYYFRILINSITKRILIYLK